MFKNSELTPVLQLSESLETEKQNESLLLATAEVSHKFAVVPSHLFVRRTNRDIRDDSFIIDPSISSHVCSRILLLDRESIYYTYLCYIMIPLQ